MNQPDPFSLEFCPVCSKLLDAQLRCSRPKGCGRSFGLRATELPDLGGAGWMPGCDPRFVPASRATRTSMDSCGRVARRNVWSLR